MALMLVMRPKLARMLPQLCTSSVTTAIKSVLFESPMLCDMCQFLKQCITINWLWRMADLKNCTCILVASTGYTSNYSTNSEAEWKIAQLVVSTQCIRTSKSWIVLSITAYYGKQGLYLLCYQWPNISRAMKADKTFCITFC